MVNGRIAVALPLVGLALCAGSLVELGRAQAGVGEPLPFPGLLKRAERERGNPLATYAALLELADRYRKSDVFAGIYEEVRCNYEEFLGVPDAGEMAMALPALRAAGGTGASPVPEGFEPQHAVAVIAGAAERTRVVIFGEEHHLPQTRSLYEALLRALWDKGYRYLAAETFSTEVTAPEFTVCDYRSGYYTMDPVFASAVRAARKLGYKLVSYDTSERGPAGDASFRDRTQAENLKKRVFDADRDAKLLVFAGRGHAAEVPPADGWTPMASVLKKITGIDPLTIYAPTMSQRKTPAEEHPIYRDATARNLVRWPTIFVDKDAACLGSGNCDAYVFWPRVALVEGRPDWLVKTMGRKAIAAPAELRPEHGLVLLQAFLPDEPVSAVPVDQILLRVGESAPALMLPVGVFRVRAVDSSGKEHAAVTVEAR